MQFDIPAVLHCLVRQVLSLSAVTARRLSRHPARVLSAIDAISGKVLHRWEQSKDIVDISVSANGRLIAVTTGSPIIDVYDKETGKRSQSASSR